MFVGSWSLEFTPEQPPITSATVGVELRGVPYLLFNKESLCRIATAVGKPVSLAPETERKENFEVKKFTVKVNLLKELPRKIISGFSYGKEVEISVSYPWLPKKCAECNAYGHDSLYCPRKPSFSLNKGKIEHSRRRHPSRKIRDRAGPSQVPTYRPISRCSTSGCRRVKGLGSWCKIERYGIGHPAGLKRISFYCSRG